MKITIELEAEDIERIEESLVVSFTPDQLKHLKQSLNDDALEELGERVGEMIDMWVDDNMPVEEEI